LVPEGWAIERLENLAQVERGKFTARPRNNPSLYGGAIPFVQTGDIRLSGGWLKNYSQTLNEQGLRVSRIFPAGTILITIAANIGDVAIATFPVACPDSIVAIQPSKKVSNIWLMYVLQTHQEDFEGLATQNAQKNINLETLRPFKILIPPLPEQRAIAAILSTWDEAITLTTRLIDALKRRKAALMQLLLTGEVRFSEFDGAWEEIRLGDFLKLNLRKVAKPNNPYYALSLRNRGQGTLVRFVKDPTSVEMEHLYEVRGGDLIVSITFAWEGSIAIARSDADGKLVSHRFPTYVFDKSKVNPDFFKHLMITDDFFFQLGLISPGGAGRNRVLSKKDFVQLTVNVPELAEQMKIGGLLSAYDEYIDGFESYLAQLTTQKRGLMQQLLTGAVRVQVGEDGR